MFFAWNCTIVKILIFHLLWFLENVNLIEWTSGLFLPYCWLKETVSRDFWPFLKILNLNLGTVWTGKNGFTNCFLSFLAKIFAKIISRCSHWLCSVCWHMVNYFFWKIKTKNNKSNKKFKLEISKIAWSVGLGSSWL